MKTADLTGKALDWAVAKCEGHTPLYENAPHANLRNKLGNIWHLDELNYSTDWSQGGPIIEREKMTLGKQVHKNDWSAESFNGEGIDTAHIGFGPTPLIAAMRCYVASKLGDEVEVPEELMS